MSTMRAFRQPLRAALRTANKPSTSMPQTSGIVRQHIQRATYSAPAPPSRSAGPPLTNPLNISKWLEQNAHLLQPPINNYCVYNDPLTVMIVGGPNARTDYHINSTPEFFYQHAGRMLLKTVDPATDSFKDIYINEGELFLLPPNVPHNPVRFGGTVGVVIELPRPEGSVDRLRWFCGGCGETVAERAFVCTDLGSQIKEAVNQLGEDREARTCGKCGTVAETRPTEEEMERMRTAPS